jgi:integrase
MSKRRSNGQGSIYRRAADGPWIAQWYGHDGKRIERSTRTTDKRAAERILARRVSDAALRRDGVIDPRDDRFAAEARRPLADHVRDYLASCQRAGLAEKHLAEKRRHLDRLLATMPGAPFSALTADALERHLGALAAEPMAGSKRKPSARTVNFARQAAVAFMSWAVKTGRTPSNPLRVVPKLDERKDRRRVRRPLTDGELTRLLAAAEARGRRAWYLAAALAGLRKGDLQRLTWADVDFEAGTITVGTGKAKRVDQIPLHPDLAEELRRLRAERRATPKARVFPETVTDRTRLLDFLRAGIAREVGVVDAEGKPVMVGKRKRRQATRIVAEDDEGRVIDLHALRTTLGTKLARAGVAPQIAQRIMRHGDYRTTLAHYTVLGLTDTAGAMAGLRIDGPDDQREAATGTDGRLADTPRQKPGNGGTREYVLVRHPAATEGAGADAPALHNSREDADLCASLHGGSEVERSGLEPPTSSLQSWHSTN